MGLLVTGIMLLVGGMLGLRVAVGVTRQELRLAGGRTAPGQVVAFRTRQSRDRGRVVTYTFPVVRFRTAEGVDVEQESQYSYSGAGGQQVQVRYAPDDPTLCRVATSRVGSVGVALAWVVTAGFTVAGVAVATSGLQEVI